jgi:hypothetical protein
MSGRRIQTSGRPEQRKRALAIKSPTKIVAISVGDLRHAGKLRTTRRSDQSARKPSKSSRKRYFFFFFAFFAFFFFAFRDV